MFTRASSAVGLSGKISLLCGAHVPTWTKQGFYHKVLCPSVGFSLDYRSERLLRRDHDGIFIYLSTRSYHCGSFVRSTEFMSQSVHLFFKDNAGVTTMTNQCTTTLTFCSVSRQQQRERPTLFSLQLRLLPQFFVVCLISHEKVPFINSPVISACIAQWCLIF